MKSQLRPAFFMLLIFTVMTGVIYPLAVTGIAQVAFPKQANGSLSMVNGKAVGSELIGQQFSDPKYFWGRLSDTGDSPYNAFNAEPLWPSSRSLYRALNPALIQDVQDRIVELKPADADGPLAIPLDLL